MRMHRSLACTGRSPSSTNRSMRVASEFNRYSSRPIEIATPALRKLEISGQFATDDTESVVAFPAQPSEHVHVEVTATRIIVSQN